ncbi:hypothetical protein D3C71_1463420 [compost metagenome]
MGAAPGAGRAERQLAGVLPGVGDQFAHRVHRQRSVHHQYDGKDRRHPDRHEVGADVVAEVVAQAGQHCVMNGGEKEVVAVGFRLGGKLRAHDAACARLVVHHGGHRPELPQRLCREAGGGVHRSTRGKGHDEGYGMARPGCGTGPRRKHGGGACGAQPRDDAAAFKIDHGSLLSLLLFTVKLQELPPAAAFLLFSDCPDLPLHIFKSPSFARAPVRSPDTICPVDAVIRHMA